MSTKTCSWGKTIPSSSDLIGPVTDMISGITPLHMDSWKRYQLMNPKTRFLRMHGG
jgi:hypothetical protein